MSPVPQARDAPPIRVVHIITRLILGGAQENTLLSVEGLQRRPGYEAALVSGPALGPEGELVRRARRHGVDLEIVPEMRREIHPLRDAASFARLCGILRRRRPHIVHTHSSKAGILGRAAARVVGVPCIVHTVHGPSFHPHQSALMNRLAVASERLAAKWSDAIVSVADAMTDQFVAAGVAPRGRFVTIYSGMEVEPFLASDGARERVRRRLGIGGDEIVIGKIARLFHLKGHRFVLDAAPGILERFPNVRFLFVGDGILREALQRRAERLGVADRIVFAGLVEPDEVPAMIKAMDLVVHASLREGLARVLPQALLSGRPVVSFDQDGAREVVVDGETGFLVRTRSSEALAAGLLRALSDLDAARALAAEGRRRFTDRFRAETMVRRLDALYRRLLRSA